MNDKHPSCKHIGCKGGTCEHYCIDCFYSEKEITFGGEGCVLSISLKNQRDNEILKRYYEQCKRALEQFPKSHYWKDAVAYLDRRIG